MCNCYCGCNDPDYAFLLKKIEQMMEDFKKLNTDLGREFTTVKEEFAALKKFTTDYFQNLDVQQEVNTKLDEMYESGQIAAYFGNTKYNVSTDPIPTKVPIDSTFNQVELIEISDAGLSNYELNQQAKALYDQGVNNSTVRVSTFNIGAFQSGRTPYKPNRMFMEKYIHMTKAAIIGFQEMQTVYNVAPELIYADDFRKYASMDLIPDYSHDFFGEGVASVNQITDFTGHKFESQPPQSSNIVKEEQYYTHCNIAVGSKILSVYNVHLYYKAIDSQEGYSIWKGQRDELLKAMDADPNPYRICVGDFNIRQNDTSTIGYDGLAPFTLKGYKLVNGTKYGTLWNAYAVDDIIVSPEITIVDSGMISSPIPTGGIDHNALWADLKLN